MTARQWLMRLLYKRDKIIGGVLCPKKKKYKRVRHVSCGLPNIILYTVR